jgi:hypothetical protein
MKADFGETSVQPSRQYYTTIDCFANVVNPMIAVSKISSIIPKMTSVAHVRVLYWRVKALQ